MAWSIVFGRPFVKLFALFCGTVVTPVCLSVMLVYYCQTVGWIKMPLGVEVDLGPGHIVLDGDQAPPHGKAHSTAAPTFQPVSIVAKWSPISATAELLFVKFQEYSLLEAHFSMVSFSVTQVTVMEEILSTCASCAGVDRASSASSDSLTCHKHLFHALLKTATQVTFAGFQFKFTLICSSCY